MLESALWLSIVGNVVLSLVKLAVGVAYGSVALVSDGVHSLSDVLTSIIGLWGLRVSLKPPDSSHPFGHARFEPLVAFMLGEILLLVSYEIGKEAILQIFHKTQREVNFVLIYVAGISIIAKEVMARYALYVGKRYNNQILIADAYHHRSDALSSVVVVVGLLAQKLGFSYGDALAALIVAIMLVKLSWDIMRKNVKFLTGEAPPCEILDRIKREVLKHPNVVGVHNLRAHYVGTNLHVQVHIEVPSECSLEKAHSIEKDIEKAIESLDVVDKAFVHVDMAKL